MAMAVADDWEAEFECCVCLQVKADIAEFTCCHNTICESCYTQLRSRRSNCPVCRAARPAMLVSEARRRTVQRRFNLPAPAPIPALSPLLPAQGIPNRVNLLRSQARGDNIPAGSTWPLNSASHYQRALEEEVLRQLMHEGIFARVVRLDEEAVTLWRRSQGEDLGNEWPANSVTYHQIGLETYVFNRYGHLEYICRAARGIDGLGPTSARRRYWREQLATIVQLPGEDLRNWISQGTLHDG